MSDKIKFKLNHNVFYEFTKTQKKVFGNETKYEDIPSFLEKKISLILSAQYEGCFNRLRDEWVPKLEDRGIDVIPVTNDGFSELVFAQPDYHPF